MLKLPRNFIINLQIERCILVIYLYNDIICFLFLGNWASSILNLGCIGRHLSFSNSTAGSRGKFPLHGIRETLSYISSLAKFALN